MRRFLVILTLAGAAAAAVVASPAWQHVVSRGFGNPGNSYLLEDATYKGFLYVGTQAHPSTKLWSGSAKAGGDVWRTPDGSTWHQVGTPGLGNPANVRIKQLVVFRNRLYAITGNDTQGIEVWVSSGGPFKRIAKGFSESEKTALFSKTAMDVYRLKLD